MQVKAQAATFFCEAAPPLSVRVKELRARVVKARGPPQQQSSNKLHGATKPAAGGKAAGGKPDAGSQHQFVAAVRNYQTQILTCERRAAHAACTVHRAQRPFDTPRAAHRPRCTPRP